MNTNDRDDATATADSGARGAMHSDHGAIVPRARTNSGELGRPLALATRLPPGVGFAVVTRNGETVAELHDTNGERGMTAFDAEELALADPEQEWCIHVVGLLDDRRYRRAGNGRWLLYRRGYGLS
ncbi:MAG: hypothetical protein D4R74_04425 [Betaproteobacteria bacterium]|nr:MAG: hypothetical protein D4R74_04425 [Betaproteobacteria bacterium]